jgi:hypothetical protein
MPFGLKNATSTFKRTMSEVFKELGSRFLKVFVDDLNVHSESWGEHLQHLDAVLCKLSVATLTWPSVGVKPNTWKSWGFGVLRDSRVFRARQQGEKHLALGCS